MTMPMDLQSCLLPGDLFVSFWLGRQMTVVVGNQSGVLSVEQIEISGLEALVNEFERCVSEPDHYAAFLAESLRPSSWPAPVTTAKRFVELLVALRARIISPMTRELLTETRFDRLLIFPDGLLHALPFELLLFPSSQWRQPEFLSRGVIYAPSASAYAYAIRRRRRKPIERALIVVGDPNDPSLVREAQRVAAKIPGPSASIATMAELREQTGKADLIYIATHGEAPGPSNLHRGWTLLFDGGSLGAEDFYRERVKLAEGATVVLSACSAGRVQAGSAHEIDGLIHGLFYGGAATVLAARWPVLEQLAELVFGGTLDRALREHVGFGTALRLELSRVTEQPELWEGYPASAEVLPFFLGGFTLFGSGD